MRSIVDVCLPDYGGVLSTLVITDLAVPETLLYRMLPNPMALTGQSHLNITDILCITDRTSSSKYIIPATTQITLGYADKSRIPNNSCLLSAAGEMVSSGLPVPTLSHQSITPSRFLDSWY